MSRLGLRLTPHGRLSVEDQDDAPDIDAAASIRLIDAFARGTGYGLVWLGAAEVGQALPPLFVWWRDFAALYVGSLCLGASGMEAEERGKLPGVPAPTAAELSSLLLTAPIMAGAEYLTQDVLLALWDEMERAFAACDRSSGCQPARFPQTSKKGPISAAGLPDATKRRGRHVGASRDRRPGP